MANEIKNILAFFPGEGPVVEKILSEISGSIEYKGESYPLIIDFEKIKPTPPELQDTAAIRKWRRENWGTKCCYAYGQKQWGTDSIAFLTAWTGVPLLMGELSKKYPEVEMMYLHDAQMTDDGLECGDFWIEAGELYVKKNRALKGTPEFDRVKEVFAMYEGMPANGEEE